MKESIRILLLVDWVPQKGAILFESFRKQNVHCDIMGTNFKLSQWNPIRKIFSHWPRCLWVSLKAFGLRNKYDYVIAWPQVIGTFLGFIKFITRSNDPKIFSLNATIVERKNAFIENIRKLFISLSYRNVNHISCLSEANMHLIQERFHLSKNQCVHLKQPMTTEIIPEFSGFKPNSYLYSVGLSYRDYPTLMAAAQKSSRQFAVATTDVFLKGLTIPDNVTIYRNTFGSAAEELMRNAAAVIFPLERTTSPAGETTLISAMFHGKPVITTKTITTQEYITDGQNGLLVPWKDPDAIVEAINTLFADPNNADAMGRRARQTALENHTMEVYTKKIVDIVRNDLYGTSLGS